MTPRNELTSTARMSKTLLSLTRPCRRYCSIVAHRTLYVFMSFLVLALQPMCRPLTASLHHICSASRSALRYASTSSGTIYSRKSLENDSISKEGSIYRICRVTCAVSFSSNHEPIVDVTERNEATKGFSDSWNLCCSSPKLLRIGFVCFSVSHRSAFGASLCKTTASPALLI